MPRSLRQRGHLYKRGKPPNQMWYGRYRRSVLTKNGTVRLQTKNDRLGLASAMSEAGAWEELERRISRTRTQPAPTASVTLKEYYERHFWPDKERRLKRAGLAGVYSKAGKDTCKYSCFMRFRRAAAYYPRWVLQSCSSPSDSARAC